MMIIQTNNRNTRRVALRVNDGVYEAVFRNGRATVQDKVGKLLIERFDSIRAVEDKKEQSDKDNE